MRQLLLSLLSLVLLLGLADSARACSCGPRPTVLDEFDTSDDVVILRAISVEQVEKTELTHYYPHDTRSTTMVVEKVFKGNLKVRDQIVMGQGSGGNCVWVFNEKSIGRRFLFYLNRPKNRENVWFASECGRSNESDSATEDLLYLQNLPKVRGRTRVSGALTAGWANANVDVEGKTIKIIGPKKTYETKTDDHGVFEIYDLPPGKYLIEPETPAGWKIDPYMLKYSTSVVIGDHDKPEMKSPKQFAVTLEPKKHASVYISVIIDNYVRGRVIGPKGIPMPNVCVSLLRRGRDWASSDCTNEDGRFEISSVPEGEWILGANIDDQASSRAPFRKIFYPGVTELERAMVITIGPGDIIHNIDLVIPGLVKTVTIEGVLRYSDGNPVADEPVEFRATKADAKVDGVVRERTDSAGRFSLKVLKGWTGELAGEDWISQGAYRNCPKVDELIAQSGSNNITVRSNVVTLTTEQNVYDIELTFPFPRCEKAKE